MSQGRDFGERPIVTLLLRADWSSVPLRKVRVPLVFGALREACKSEFRGEADIEGLVFCYNDEKQREVGFRSEEGFSAWCEVMKDAKEEGITTLRVARIGGALSGRGPVGKREAICFGDRIRLVHRQTRAHLHSHHSTYATGSRQQQVTGFRGRDDNDWWVVLPRHEKRGKEDELRGQAVRCGSVIRLQHFLTRFRLHSHGGHRSPVTNQQEATCYAGGDTNDDWTLQAKEEKEEELWLRGMAVNLVHVNTKHTLHSHRHQLPNWGHGQQEITAYRARDANDDWVVEEIPLRQTVPKQTSG